MGMNEVREGEIRRIGRKLIEFARAEETEWAKKHRWENALLDWCMTNEELKIRTFRFIDVFPTLKSPRAVLNHIREYFPLTEHRIPRAVRAGLAIARPAVFTQSAIFHLTHTMFRKISNLFIAAENEEEASNVINELNSQGIN